MSEIDDRLAGETGETDEHQTDEQLMASGDAAIAFEAVPAPVAPKQRGSKKPNKRTAKTDRGEDAKKRPKKASRSKGNAVAKKSKKRSVTKSVVGAAKKAKKTVKKATKKKKNSKR